MERPPSQREAVVGLLHQRREARAREEGREAHGRPRGRPPPRRHVRHRRRGRRVRAQGEPAGDVAQDRRRRDRGETLVMIPIRDGRRLVIYGSGYLWTIGSINNPADGGRRRAPRGESKRTSRVTRARRTDAAPCGWRDYTLKTMKDVHIIGTGGLSKELIGYILRSNLQFMFLLHILH